MRKAHARKYAGPTGLASIELSIDGEYVRVDYTYKTEYFRRDTVGGRMEYHSEAYVFNAINGSQCPCTAALRQKSSWTTVAPLVKGHCLLHIEGICSNDGGFEFLIVADSELGAILSLFNAETTEELEVAARICGEVFPGVNGLVPITFIANGTYVQIDYPDKVEYVRCDALASRVTVEHEVYTHNEMPISYEEFRQNNPTARLLTGYCTVNISGLAHHRGYSAVVKKEDVATLLSIFNPKKEGWIPLPG